MKVEQSQSKIGVMYLSGKKENVLSKTQKAGCRTGRKGFRPVKNSFNMPSSMHKLI